MWRTDRQNYDSQDRASIAASRGKKSGAHTIPLNQSRWNLACLTPPYPVTIAMPLRCTFLPVQRKLQNEAVTVPPINLEISHALLKGYARMGWDYSKNLEALTLPWTDKVKFGIVSSSTPHFTLSSAYLKFYSPLYNPYIFSPTLIDWVKILCPTWHKIDHFRDVPQANLLAWYGKTKLNATKACIR